MDRLYFDYAATTPTAPEVIEAMQRVHREQFGNASSVHAFGRDAKRVLEESRERIASELGAAPDEVFFTSGGTEADNTALIGVADWALGVGKTHLVISAVEHHAVLHTANYLRKRGMELTVVRADRDGMVDAGDVAGAMNARTCLLSIMHANNEVGTLQPVRQIAEEARARGVHVHTDAVQSFGKVSVNVDDLGVDLLSVSAHKVYGPKGIGALYIRKGTRVEPMFHGGGQESGRRPGTENVPLAAGFAAAVALFAADREAEQKRLRTLRDLLKTELLTRFAGLLVNGSRDSGLATILNVSFDSSTRPLDGDALIMGMDLRGIAVTSGSACTSGSLQASHVLLAMGRDERTARATIRFSFGRTSTRSDVERAANALEEVVTEAERGRR